MMLTEPAAAPTVSTVLWDLTKILLPMGIAWGVATRRARTKAEASLGSNAVQSAVDSAVKELEKRLGTRFDGLEADMEKAAEEGRRRMDRMDFVLFGVDGRGGMVEEAERVRRRIDEDHEVLLNVNLLVRELYRRVTREEPPAPPPSPMVRDWRQAPHPPEKR